MGRCPFCRAYYTEAEKKLERHVCRDYTNLMEWRAKLKPRREGKWVVLSSE